MRLFSRFKFAIASRYVAAAALVLAISREGLAKDGGMRRGPAPSWVGVLAADWSSAVDPAAARNGVYTLLSDTRIRLTKKGTERFQRRVDKVVSQGGVDDLAQRLIEFAPAYEQLTLHAARVIRGSQTIDQTQTMEVRLLDQESDLEHLVYSGTRSALLLFHDVREGDIVEVAYSIRGMQPVFGGRYATEISIGSGLPIWHRHIEIRRDRDRPGVLRHLVRGTAPELVAGSGGNEDLWTLDQIDVPARPDEDRVPSSHDVPARLELSEFADWNEVARWGADLFPRQNSTMLDRRARELAADGDQATAALRAIRFVQDDVRYFSASLGQYAMRPHGPAQILGQRFGDCKDKSYLLVELLRRIGLEAHPALANTELREHLEGELPSPDAFDHALVEVIIDGRTRWIDATRSQQGGTLLDMAAPDLGFALVLRPDTQALSPVVPDRRESPPQSAKAAFRVQADGRAHLEVTTDYDGPEADEIRGTLATAGPADLSEKYIDYYGRSFKDIALAHPLVVEDEREKNHLVTREGYEIPRFWEEGTRTLEADSIREYLSAPRVIRRRAPLALSYPVWIREITRVELPFAVDWEPSTDTIEDSTVRLHQSVSTDGKVVTAIAEYRALTSVVPLAEVPAHLATLSRAREKLGFTLERPENATPSPPGSDTLALIVGFGAIGAIGLFAIGGLVIGVGVIRRRLRRRAFLEQRDGARGETPARPLTMPTAPAALAFLASQRCPWDGGVASVSGDLSPIRFGGEVLRVGQATCVSCGATRRLYFRIDEAAPPAS